ncbi:MAG: response regulator [Actinomycetota bacterium]
MIKVLIADDEELVRTGLRMILEAEDDMTVVGDAADGDQALQAVARLEPDVILMDIRMPTMDGLEVTRRVTDDPSTAARVVVLTTFDLDEYVYEALRIGASGFLLKDAPAAQLITAIHAAAAGDALLAPSITRRLIDDFTRRAPPSTPPRLDALSPRETDVLLCIARGLTNQEIAQELFVGEATVKTHVAHVLLKLGVRDRVQAVIAAYESGLVRSEA